MNKYVLHHITGREMHYPLVVETGYIHFDQARLLDMHSHEGYELVFLIEGVQSYETERGEVYECKSGEYLLFERGIMHKPLGGYEIPSLIIWLIIDPDLECATTCSPFSESDLQAMRTRLERSKNSVQSFNSDLAQNLQRYRRTLERLRSPSPLDNSLTLLRSLSGAIIIDALNQLKSTPPQCPYGESAVHFIEQHYLSPISVADIADYLGYSENRTYTLFKQYTGLAPIEYVLRLRIHTSKGLLKTSARSVSDIAFSCGFNSSQYFARMFRKYVGVSPTTYRKSALN